MRARHLGHLVRPAKAAASQLPLPCGSQFTPCVASPSSPCSGRAVRADPPDTRRPAGPAAAAGQCARGGPLPHHRSTVQRTVCDGCVGVLGSCVQVHRVGRSPTTKRAVQQARCDGWAAQEAPCSVALCCPLTGSLCWHARLAVNRRCARCCSCPSTWTDYVLPVLPYCMLIVLTAHSALLQCWPRATATAPPATSLRRCSWRRRSSACGSSCCRQVVGSAHKT